MCATCNGDVYVADGQLCPECVCPDCLDRQARTATYALPEEWDDDPQDCRSTSCGWARVMGLAA
ncbi:hypothetical protein [Streptomyces sp. NPDC059008]|uniref:hypothetical protein n=1 Tax=Streptomyces sp. NPDC059008 TaxID=3346693 RepID=UPI0036A19FA0